MPFTTTHPGVAAQLKENTHTGHTAAEALLGPRLEAIASPEDYAAILTMFYGFFQPLETVIARFVTPAVLPDAAERRNADFLLEDLTALGQSVPSLPLCERLPQIDSLPAALGALYVLEGSTLGGRMIKKMLLRNPHLSLTEDHLHFFNGYGERTGEKWRTFLALLEAYPQDADAMTDAANQTFDCLTQWMHKTLS